MPFRAGRKNQSSSDPAPPNNEDMLGVGSERSSDFFNLLLWQHLDVEARDARSVSKPIPGRTAERRAFLAFLPTSGITITITRSRTSTMLPFFLSWSVPWVPLIKRRGSGRCDFWH
eukprot:292426-Rhodomonas_salina.1